ncbi:hypothetical protein J3F84DRAFT_100969 [Trichoderma pleuroticola]
MRCRHIVTFFFFCSTFAGQKRQFAIEFLNFRPCSQCNYRDDTARLDSITRRYGGVHIERLGNRSIALSISRPLLITKRFSVEQAVIKMPCAIDVQSQSQRAVSHIEPLILSSICRLSSKVMLSLSIFYYTLSFGHSLQSNEVYRLPTLLSRGNTRPTTITPLLFTNIGPFSSPVNVRGISYTKETA